MKSEREKLINKIQSLDLLIQKMSSDISYIIQEKKKLFNAEMTLLIKRESEEHHIMRENNKKKLAALRKTMTIPTLSNLRRKRSIIIERLKKTE